MAITRRMVVRTGACLLLLLVLLSAPLLGGFRLSNPESPVYYRYALIAGERIQIVEGTQVAGDVHSNGDVSTASGVLIDGNASAVGTITGPGTVTGTESEGTAPVALPRLATAAELQAMADRTLQGNQTFTDAVVDDVVFIDGRVRIQGSLGGGGTILATSDITFESSSAVPGQGTRISVVSLGSITLAQDRSFRGILYSSQDVQLGRGVRLEGVVLAGRRAHLNGDARLTFVDFDAGPPVITLQSPAAGSFLRTATPQITLAFSDDLSGVDPATVVFTLDNQDRTGQATVSATGLSFQPSQPLPDGPHAIEVRVSDHSGKEAFAEFSFTTDTVAPTLRIASPGPLVDGDTTPAVIVDFSDATSGVDPATLAVKVDGSAISCVIQGASAVCEPPELAEGSHTVSAEIADRAGNRSTTTSAFVLVLDSQPPVLRIVSPSAGRIVGDATPEIVLEYSDPGSGVDLSTLSVVLDGQDLTAACDVQPETATCAPPLLATGPHTLKVAIEDRRGLHAERERFFEISLQLSLVIESPVQGELTQSSTVEISGTVSPEADSVSVDDIEGILQDGVFLVADVPLHEGGNTLTVVARSEGGGIGTATVTVVRDTATPRVVIAAPRAGLVTTSPQIAVTGEYVDPLSSNADVAPPVVKVNGFVARTELRTFFYDGLLLQPGENLIRVTVTDTAGNEGSAEVAVTLVPDAAQRIEMLLGDGQSGPAGQRLADPLVVRLRDVIGNPLPGRRVLFQVTRGGGQVAAGGEEESRLSVMTDEQGRAQADFFLGSRAGAGNHEVTVTSAGFPGEVTFCASATVTESRRIVRTIGDDHTGAMLAAVSSPYPKPLLTQVFDDQGNPVQGVPVTYRVISGGGSFAGAETVTEVTNGQGIAAASFTLGPQPGIGVNFVEAGFEGLAELPVVFAITGVVPGAEAETAVVGLVLDNQDDPVPGVTLSIKDTDLEVVSDAQGRFRIAGVPVGTVLLEVDGKTTSRPGTWPYLMFHFTTISGVDNSLGMPIRLLPIDIAGGKLVGGPEEVVIQMKDVPGATLTVAPNSVTFPDGSKTGIVSFTQVHGDKVPMIAPMGSGFTVAFTVQPPGTRFDPPAVVTLPNIGLPPGSEIDLFSFDHDIGEFLTVGTATVTPDGLLLRSNPGTGITKAGWAGGVPPPPPTTDVCHSGDCTVCVDNRPVPKCDEACQTCEGGTCKDMTIEEIQATADGEEEKRIQAADEAVQFSAKMTRGTCKTVKFDWDFGDTQSPDNTAQDNPSPSHVYKKPGAYRVKATARCGECTGVGTKEDEVKVLIVKVDLRVRNLPEEDQGPPHEEDPGAVLGVRDDGKPKYRAPVQVVFEGPSEINIGELKLDAPGGRTKIRIFQDAGGNNQVPLPKIWPIRSGGMTESLFVEAVQPSDSVKDLELSLEYSHDDVSATDSAKGTALAVDARVDSDNDGSITDTDDNVENQAPGRIVVANDDDDNNNNTVDRQESSPVPGEDDLVELKLTLKPANPAGLTGLKLEISPSAELRVWKESSKGTAVAAGTILMVGTDQIPDTLWLEGVQPGQGKVELTLRNAEGDVISDDLVQVVVVRVEDVNVHTSDAETFKTPSAQQPPNLKTKLHFVTAWNQNALVLIATITPDLPEIREKVTWETTGAAALTSPAVGDDKLTASFSSNIGQGIKVPITIKITGKTAKEVVAWVVSAALTGSVSTPSVQAVSTSTGLRGGTIVDATMQPVATIFPPEIISDPDRPDLSGTYTVPPPGGSNTCNASLADGANARWDISRRIAVRSTITPSTLTLVCWDNLANYPADPEVGNDDAGVGDPEENDPYSAPALGQLTGFDKPARQGPGDGFLQNGHVGDTYQVQLWFQDFARLELGGRWFVISDPLPWRVDFRFIKVQITEALWNGDVNHDGDMQDDVTEAMLGADQNGDRDQLDNVGFWDDNGSISANDNAGKP